MSIFQQSDALIKIRSGINVAGCACNRHRFPLGQIIPMMEQPCQDVILIIFCLKNVDAWSNVAA